MTRRSVRWLFALLLGAAGCGETPQQAGSQGKNETAKRSAGGVKFVGFDGSPPLVEALRKRELQGLVLQNPYRMGQLGVKTLVEHLDGKPVKDKIPTGETLVTPDNMDQPEIVALLDPPKLPHGAGASLTGPKTKKWRVMVIPKGTSHEFWKTIHAGSVKAAEDLGNVEVAWIGPVKEDDRTEQIRLVEQAVTAKVDGIVLAPLDFKALVAPVERAIAAGIPVVVIDSALDSKKIVSYVATDNYHGGVLAGERLAELLKGEGRIILLRYAVGSASTDEREKGFTDTIAKFPKITYLSNDQYANATADTAQNTSQSLITRFGGQVEGIFCPNESSTVGMLRVLNARGMLAGRP